MRAAVMCDHPTTVDLLRLDRRAVLLEIVKTEINVLNIVCGIICLSGGLSGDLLTFNAHTRVAGLAVHTTDGVELDSRLWINGAALTAFEHAHDLLISRRDVICTSKPELSRGKQMQMQVSGVIDGSYMFDNSPGDVWKRSLNAYRTGSIILEIPRSVSITSIRVSIEYVREA